MSACQATWWSGPTDRFGSAPAAVAPEVGTLTGTPAGTPTATPAARGRAGPSSEASARHQRIFRKLWQTVNLRYVYPDFNGFDWAAAQPATEEHIATGLTDEQFYDAMRDLIGKLNDSHSSFLSPDEAQSEDDEYTSTGTYTGVGLVTDVNSGGRHLVVLTVLPDSPAERAGIQPHDAILEIAGQPSVDADGNSMSKLLRGEDGTSVEVVVRTPGQVPRRVQMIRGRVTSTEHITSRILPGTARIGLLDVPSLFEENVTTRTRSAMLDLMKDGPLDGLILDLRTNGGGSYPNLRGLLGLFTSGTVGHLVNRAGARTTVRVRPNGIGNSQTVPLVVLIGPSTESFAEVLAGVLQAKGRARLIGQNTAGNIETLLAHEFEDGSRLWLAEESFRLPNGSSWELIGLNPDTRVEGEWDQYTAQDDPVIARALRMLNG
jgi:C-terminal peptidase prc